MSPLATQPTRHPVYKALHRPLTICGVERRLFFGALLVGALTFNLFSSFLGGLLISISLYVAALSATKRDPQILPVILRSSRYRTRYDPGKHTPVHVEVRS